MRSGNRRPRAANAIIDDAPGLRQNSPDQRTVYSQQNGTASRQTSSDDAVNVLQRHVADLTRQLQEVRNHNEDLEQDVEYLQLQQQCSLFDSSMIFRERASDYEKKHRLVKSQLASLTVERDNLNEDLRGLRDSLRSKDASWRAEQERANKAESERRWYQDQSKIAYHERDQAKWELEQLKSIEAELEKRCSKAETACDTAQSEQAELEQRLSDANSLIEHLQKKAEECEEIPSLKATIKDQAHQLEAQDAEIHSLQGKQQSLERKCSGLTSDLEAMTKKASELDELLDEARGKAAVSAKAAAQTIQKLEARVKELEEANAALESRVDDAEGNLAASQAEAETAANEAVSRADEQQAALMERQNTLESSYTMKVAELDIELEDTRKRLAEMEERCVQATKEKVETLLRASQFEQAAKQAAEDIEALQGRLSDLEANEKQAKQEKVAALMQVAELENQLKGGEPATTQNRGYGWRERLWGTTSPAAGTKEAPGGSPKQEIKMQADSSEAKGQT